jgi:xanthine dehydrogenase iron-sulfur cluster and FAD-binding subunit A
VIDMKTNIRVNNTTHELSLDSRLTLLDALREVLGLTGTKKGCDQGACGACTVIIEGHRVLCCLTLAAACEGQHAVTIEGLAKGDELHPMRAAFLKVRDRASYEFALASAAVVLDLDGDTIRAARLGLGGIATKPWRATEAEHILTGRKASDDTFRDAAEIALAGAVAREHNHFKIELAKRTIVRAFATARDANI